MEKVSYLLEIDGSASALSAAHFAWDLAQYANARVVAQHVLDTPKVRDFLAYSIPGFVGSGPYIEAQGKITEALRAAAETVMLSYSSQGEGNGHQNTETFIDEGDTVIEICKRAKDHDLVILAQINAVDSNTHSAMICSELAKQCLKPVVFVQVTSTPRSGIHLLIANANHNQEAAATVVAYAKSASIPVQYSKREELAVNKK